MERISVQREGNGDDGPALGRLVAATRDFATRNGLGKRQAHRLCIVAEELAANALGHGAASSLSIDLEMMGGAVRLTMRDDGPPYDLRNYVAQDRPDDVEGGGAGIAIIRAWCEVLDYTAGPKGNQLDLVLRLERT